MVRVLYVDDDAGLGVLLRKALAPQGISVVTVETGDEAMAKLGEGGFDIVALDHNLTHEVGLNLIPKIRALNTPPPVIYVTGSDDARVAVAALKAGAVDYVWKDVEGHYRELLGESVKTALEQEALKRRAEDARRQVEEARDRAEMLLHEVNHRVANSLALVSSFVQLQANALSDPAAKQMLKDTQARITAVAGVHRTLYTSHDVRFVEVNTYIASLVEELAASASHRCIVGFTPAPEPVPLPTDRAVSLGVVVTELVTNACKYAYGDCGSGDVRVVIAPAPDAGRLQVRVEDDGIGWDGEGAIQGSGLGSRIIRALANSLQASLVYEKGGRGTRAVLEVPLTSPA
ncbi:two-component sensor histidine kinase [Rhizomicrobium palustre]|uniref:histidine kinase n=1 Tax=Rhizomicrobium palustre TaxID=189966 RepID=A0A846N1U6_9PROT|nr:histidine kinase dimerization/phosphoacceptor domain -containing protein [Rhizomicrobium palustre]NIK89583.1 two-component sensor histidine kinase [Rhizomicrobium palustre]